MAQNEPQVSGVAELITRLRDEGVSAGRDEAKRLIKEAQERANTIVAEAKAKSDAILTEARADIEAERTASHEAIKVAIRDTGLELEADLKAGFAAHVKRLVSMEMQDREFLRQLVLLVASQAIKGNVEGKKIDVIIPPEWFEVDEKGARLTEKGKQRAKHFVLGLSGEMLREGVELQPGEDSTKGIKVKLVGEDVEIDMTENAISGFLLKYLLPRFRAIVEGVE
jgi:V/A-type H+-transporting ATPase subunit E